MLVFPVGMNVGVRVEDARLDAPLAEKPHRLHGARAAARVKQQLHLVLVCMFHARYTTISRLERDDVHGNCESVASRRMLNSRRSLQGACAVTTQSGRFSSARSRKEAHRGSRSVRIFVLRARRIVMTTTTAAYRAVFFDLMGRFCPWSSMSS